MSSLLFDLHRISLTTGKPLAPVPYRWHPCDHCQEPSLVEHGVRTQRPKQGRCVFCGKPRLKKEQA